MNSDTQKFVTCGMYAFTDELRSAWQALFDQFFKIFEQQGNIQTNIRFDTDFPTLRDPALLIGHTCGYPLMRFLSDDLVPFCVPTFDLPGCHGKHYSSQIIVPNGSNLQSLSDCRGLVAAINGRDSNSGMNVFRHAVAGLSGGKPFFKEVIESGSHYQSLIAVANNQALVATIDCVSFALIKDQWPELVNRVETIGYTEPTCGLPFVVPIGDFKKANSEALIKSLNIALNSLTETERTYLHLKNFEPVKLSNYDSILTLEKMAMEAGYPEIA